MSNDANQIYVDYSLKYNLPLVDVDKNQQLSSYCKN